MAATGVFNSDALRAKRNTVKFPSVKHIKPRSDMREPRCGWGKPQIDYNFDSLCLGEPTPVIAAKITVDNIDGGSMPVTERLQYSENSTTGTHVEDEVNAQVKVGTEVTCGVPCLAEGKVSVEASVGGATRWGKTTQNSKTVHCDVGVTAAHGEKIQGKAILTKQKFAIYFTMTTAHQFQGLIPLEMTTSGWFEGESSFNLDVQIVKLNT